MTGALVDDTVAAAAVADSAQRGYLDGKALAGVFAWLRPNDLIWNYWVNNYLLGKDPPAFDILYWNADSTRMPAALHRDFIEMSWTTRSRAPGGLTVLGTPVDLSKVDADAYIVAGISDHITPWQNAYRDDADARLRAALRAVHQRAHRRDGQPARQREGQLPARARQPARSP